MTKFTSKIIYLFFFGLLYSSCSSNYRFSESVTEELCKIELITNEDFSVNSLESSTFFESFNEILCDQSRKKENSYYLTVKFKEETSPLALHTNTDILRKNIQNIIEFNLYEKNNDKKEIFHGKFRQISSFNTLFSPYSSDLEEQEMKNNLSKSAAEEIKMKLMLFFQNRQYTK